MFEPHETVCAASEIALRHCAAEQRIIFEAPIRREPGQIEVDGCEFWPVFNECGVPGLAKPKDGFHGFQHVLRLDQRAFLDAARHLVAGAEVVAAPFDGAMARPVGACFAIVHMADGDQRDRAAHRGRDMHGARVVGDQDARAFEQRGQLRHGCLAKEGDGKAGRALVERFAEGGLGGNAHEQHDRLAPVAQHPREPREMGFVPALVLFARAELHAHEKRIARYAMALEQSVDGGAVFVAQVKDQAGRGRAARTRLEVPRDVAEIQVVVFAVEDAGEEVGRPRAAQDELPVAAEVRADDPGYSGQPQQHGRRDAVRDVVGEIEARLAQRLDLLVGKFIGMQEPVGVVGAQVEKELVLFVLDDFIHVRVALRHGATHAAHEHGDVRVRILFADAADQRRGLEHIAHARCLKHEDTHQRRSFNSASAKSRTSRKYAKTRAA